MHYQRTCLEFQTIRFASGCGVYLAKKFIFYKREKNIIYSHLNGIEANMLGVSQEGHTYIVDIWNMLEIFGNRIMFIDSCK